MSDAATRFPFPPDDPDAVGQVRAAFHRLAVAAGDVSGRLSGDLTALAHGWGGDAANACGREVTANQRLVASAARALSDSDRAIQPYAVAVAGARTEIAGMRGRYDLEFAMHEARLHTIEVSSSTPAQRSAQRSDEATGWRGTLAGYTARYETVLAELARVARRCRGELEHVAERLAPVHPGQRDLDLAVRLAVDRTLPLQHADAAQRDAVHVTDLLTRAAAGDKAAARELAGYRLEATDPSFATAVADRLGPDGMIRLPAAMAQAMRDHPGDAARTRRDNAAILAFTSSVLATATDDTRQPHVTDAWLAELTRQGRTYRPLDGATGYWGYWGLAQILGAAGTQPPYSGHFMSTVGRDVVAWIRSVPPPGQAGIAAPFGPAASGLNAPGQGSDTPVRVEGPEPLLTDLLRAASTSAPAAQALLTPDDVDYLFHQRHWPDHGEQLGRAVEAGGTGADPASARVAALAVHAYADVIRSGVTHNDDHTITAHDDALAAIRDNIGRTVAAHIGDVNLSLNTQDQRPTGDEWNDGSTARFGRADLGYALLGAERDPAGYDAVLKAQMCFMKSDLERVATAPGTAATRLAAVTNAATDGANTLGYLVEARKQGLEATARAGDEARGRLSTYVDMGLSLIPTPPHIGNLDQFNVLITERIKTHRVLGAYAAAGDYTTQTQELLRQMLESTVSQHHLWPPGVDPAANTRSTDAPFLDHTTNPPTFVPLDRMSPDQYKAFVAWESLQHAITSAYRPALGTVNDGAVEYRGNVGLPG
jgi:uncharacterized protein YukE